mgnify:FL=1
MKETIESLPQIATCFIPGFIFLMMRKYIYLRKDASIDTVFGAVIVSFVIKTIVDPIFTFKQLEGTPSAVVCLTYYVVAIAAVIIEFLVRKAAFAGRVISDTVGLSTIGNAWIRTIGTDGKCYLSVHLNDKTSVTGTPVYYDDEVIIMTRYRITISGEESDAPRDNASITIPIANIVFTQNVYDDDAALGKMNMNVF